MAIAIVALLVALTLPTLQSIRDSGRKTACISHLRQIGVAIAAYAADHEQKIPYGPKAPPFSNAASFYPSTGAPTSLISLQNGQPVALGLLLENYLANKPHAVFCPGSDQPLHAQTELKKVGQKQAQGSYYYRHGGNTALFDNPRAKVVEPPLRLGSLGDNRLGEPIRALVIDSIFLSPPQLKSFGITPLSHHRGRFANILFSDGHVASRDNTDKRFTVDVSDPTQIRTAFDKILKVLEEADGEF